MVSETMRTHVILPVELVREIDEIAGQRKRSEYIEEAIRERIMRDQQLKAFDDVVGSLSDVDVPGWETPAAASEWVRETRRASDRRLTRWSPGVE